MTAGNISHGSQPLTHAGFLENTAYILDAAASSSSRPLAAAGFLDENSIFLDETTSSSQLQALHQLNDEAKETLIPAMVILGLFSIFGIVGNSLVCYIFCCRIRTNVQSYLIVYLAVSDLIVCIISIPAQIYNLTTLYTCNSAMICKISWIIGSFCIHASIWTLLVIAVDRYRKICKPLSQQMGSFHAKLVIIPILTVSLLMSGPSFPLYGVHTVNVTDVNSVIDAGIHGNASMHDVSTVSMCAFSDEMIATMYPKLYQAISILISIGITTTLIACYYFILSEIRKNNKRMRSFSQISNSRTSLNNSRVDMTSVVNRAELDSTSCSDLPEVFDEPKTPKSEKTSPFIASFRKNSDASRSTYYLHSLKRKSSSILNSKKTRVAAFIKENKTTRIAFVVTLVVIVSLLPHMGIKVLVFVRRDIDFNGLKGVYLILYHLGLRSLFINSVSNPIIYGVMNEKFRKQLTILYHRLISAKKGASYV